MAILDFQKPDKVIMNHSDEFSGEFEFRPLEPGYGITIGNSLRRILLSSLEGFAITSIKIQGVDHEFTTIKGVVEDVTEIILNLKQVRFKRQIEGTDSETVTLTVAGSGQVHCRRHREVYKCFPSIKSRPSDLSHGELSKNRNGIKHKQRTRICTS